MPTHPFPKGMNPQGVGTVPAWAADQQGSPFGPGGRLEGQMPPEGFAADPDDWGEAPTGARQPRYFGPRPSGPAPNAAMAPLPAAERPVFDEFGPEYVPPPLTTAEERPLKPESIIEFWGAISPVWQNVWWDGKARRVVYHLITSPEEQWSREQVARAPESQRLVEEAILRAALVVLEVDGRPVNMPLREKITWVRSWPSVLRDAVLVGYEYAVQMPLQGLHDRLNDPNSEAALTWSGEPLVGAASSADGA